MAAVATKPKEDPLIVSLFLKVTGFAIVLYGAYAAFEIRTYAIKDYGRIIHECGPASGM